MFVNYNDEGFFQTAILLETNNGIIPYNYEKTDFISFYPYLAKQLMDGKTLYVAFDYGYVGIKKSEGPYCEKQVFESEYEEKNIDFNELLIRLNDAIKNLPSSATYTQSEELKKAEEIRNNIGEFLSKVADSNNPNVKDVISRIIERIEK